MSPLEAAGLFLAGLAAGALNAVAGGGSFIGFPALLATGLDALAANATNTVALWPGSLASARAYRPALAMPGLGRVLPRLAAAVLVGASIGASLLLATPEATFRRLVPWLMLAATLLFAFGERLPLRRSGATRHGDGGPGRAELRAGTAAMLLLAIYIGYFGAGAGIVALAVFSLLRLGDIHAMNGLKALLAVVANGIAVVAFVLGGIVAWAPALAMMAGAIAGGWSGARIAQRIEPRRVRRVVAVLAALLTAALFATLPT